MLETEVAHLQECVDLSEANAEAANMELVKEKSKVESLQHELSEQMNMFNIKVVLIWLVITEGLAMGDMDSLEPINFLVEGSQV